MSVRLPQPYYVDNGSTGVILLHAYTGSANDVNMLGHYLAQQQMSVAAPNLTGHATRDPLAILQTGSITAWWQDTLSAIQRLQQQRKKPLFIFGLSLGGLFALRALEVLPGLSGGGVFCTPVLEEVGATLTPLFKQRARQTYRESGLTTAEITAKMALIEPLLQRQLAEIQQFEQTVAQTLPQLNAPVFIGQGQQDTILQPKFARRLAQQLERQTEVSYHEYVMGGHVITVDQARHELQQDVLQFINQVEFKKEG